MKNIRRFCEENYQWSKTETDKLLTSCVNESILRKGVSNGKDPSRVIKQNMATTHLDVIDVSPIDHQIIPVSGNSSVSLSRQ